MYGSKCDSTWQLVFIFINSCFSISTKKKLGCAHCVIHTFNGTKRNIMRLISLIIAFTAVIGAWGAPLSNGGQFEEAGVYGDVVPPPPS